MWALGKIYQRFGSEAETLFWFKKAIALAPDQPDVARETGLAAFAVGDMELGFKCTQAARPDDPGLIANLALAHLLHGDLTEAQSFVKKALALAPDDTISQYLAGVIRGVVEGTQPRPTSIHDVA
jgi:Flp pilus assembly protein TadD